MIFMIYVNINTKYQPIALITTIISIVSFYLENYYFKKDYINNCIHILLIQLSLSFSLYKFYDI
jgi:hypothetical protein